MKLSLWSCQTPRSCITGTSLMQCRYTKRRDWYYGWKSIAFENRPFYDVKLMIPCKHVRNINTRFTFLEANTQQLNYLWGNVHSLATLNGFSYCSSSALHHFNPCPIPPLWESSSTDSMWWALITSRFDLTCRNYGFVVQYSTLMIVLIMELVCLS